MLELGVEVKLTICLLLQLQDLKSELGFLFIWEPRKIRTAFKLSDNPKEGALTVDTNYPLVPFIT